MEILLKSKLLTLLGPTERNVLVQMFELQRERLTPFQDGLDDIRREEGTGKDVTDVVRREPNLTCQRSHVSDLAFKNFFVPSVTACEGLYQCRSGVSNCCNRVGRNDQVNFAAIPFPCCFDA